MNVLFPYFVPLEYLYIHLFFFFFFLRFLSVVALSDEAEEGSYFINYKKTTSDRDHEFVRKVDCLVDSCADLSPRFDGSAPVVYCLTGASIFI